jgi:serine/threonine protein kinase
MQLEPNLLFHDRYRLIEMKGRGSFGEVWLAHDEHLDMDVAIKVYIALDDRGLAEFKSEYTTTFGLNHPNLLFATYFGQFEKRPCLVMPFCPDAATNYIGNIDEPTLWRFIRDVASGLEYLHSVGIVHHDIKPDNILIDTEGNFLITDFGISNKMRTTFQRHSRLQNRVAPEWSMAYMAPEMFGPKPDSVNATDIWALGATLYEMCEGELPFFGQGGGMQLNGAQVPELYGNYSDELKQIVQMCLAKEGWDRPNAAQLVTYANAIIDGKQTSICTKEWEKGGKGCQYSSYCENDGDSCPSYTEQPKIKRRGVLVTIIESFSVPFVLISERISSTLKARNSIKKYKPENTLSITSYHDYNSYSSIFAPAEIKRKSHMIVQVYFHLYEETEKVQTLAKESQKDAERRDYIPLQCKLKKKDKVDVLLNIYGETLLMSDSKSIIWQGSFTKCSFDYFVPKDIDVDELSCVALLAFNGIPVGEMRFVTRIVDSPRQLNPEVIAHQYNKVFVSYSHQDESKVKFLHEGLELGRVPHFFDRKYLKAGDVFPQVIKDYINSADLFILCWSENASKSEYVQRERLQALQRAFPQVKPELDAKLRIYPMSIEPRAELPSDMKENYHFGEI